MLFLYVILVLERVIFNEVINKRTSPSFNISNDTLYCKSCHLATWLCMTKLKSFGATYSRKCCGVVNLLTRWTTSFGFPALISPTRTFWKHLQAIKLSLARSTSLLQSGKMWNLQFGHLPLTQSRLNHFYLKTLGHKVFSHRLEAFSYVWKVVWELTTFC